MIFDSTDVIILSRTIVRKGVEIASFSFDADLDDMQRRRMISELVKQISRCRVMLAIATNNVPDLAQQLDYLEENPVMMSPAMMERYMGRLSERDSEDEAALLWMSNELSAQIPLLRSAAEMADSEEDSLPSDLDALLIKAVKGIMVRILMRCKGQDPMVLGDSAQYASTTLCQCDMLLRIGSMKTVQSMAISAVIESLADVGTEDFDRIFGDVLTDDEREILDMFRSNIARFISMMYARCVFNARYPNATSIQDTPIIQSVASSPMVSSQNIH